MRGLVLTYETGQRSVRKVAQSVLRTGWDYHVTEWWRAESPPEQKHIQADLQPATFSNSPNPVHPVTQLRDGMDWATLRADLWPTFYFSLPLPL